MQWAQLSLLFSIPAFLVPQVRGMTGMGFNSLAGWPAAGEVSDGRIWDIGVAWNQIHLGVDLYDWSGLDAVVGQMESMGMRITYAIGACPLW